MLGKMIVCDHICDHITVREWCEWCASYIRHKSKSYIRHKSKSYIRHGFLHPVRLWAYAAQNYMYLCAITEYVTLGYGWVIIGD